MSAVEHTENGAAEGTKALARLQRAPIVDTVEPQTLALIASQIAPGCNKGEIGHFLELCAHYDLDPFAKEAWCAKGKTGKLLIMVGRDGLRKIAQRQGLHVDGDVVRENDEVTVTRTPDGNRVIEHSYGNPAQRGAIIGAWAEVREGGPSGVPKGYFYAPLDEYKPGNASDYSPWSKQVGVMILAAAERQAIRQATPLGGLMAVGEDEVVFDHEGTAYEVEEPPEEERLTEPEILELYTAIEQAGWSSEETQLQLAAAGAQDTSDVRTAIRTLRRDQALALIAKLTESAEPVDAEVVE